MCVEAFAVGHPITIKFLHEQIWFSVGHGDLEVTEVCDWFIKNEGTRKVEIVRLQFPYYIDVDDIDVESGSYAGGDKYSWYGDFDFNAGDNVLAVRCGIRDDSLGSFGDDAIVGTAIQAEVKLPACTSRVGDYIETMHRLNRMVVDVVLGEPIGKGQTGWLRIRVRPRTWPPRETISHLPSLPFLGAPHHFLARLAILSPKHLRKELRNSFNRPAFRVFEGELIKDQGWKTPGTLSRIEDHRISLIFPKHANVVDLVAIPHSTVIRVTPYRVPDSQDDYALHFATGSASNPDTDIVHMAYRIREYIETMMKDGSASVTHLVDRFGGNHHEVIGNFIDEMTRAGVLRCVRQEPGGETFFGLSEHKEFKSQLIKLRDAYTFPDSDTLTDGSRPEWTRRRFLRMRDLHPFLISFTLEWVAYSPSQLERMSCLDDLITEQLRRRHLHPFPRAAVLVGCSEYDHEAAYPRLPLVPTILDKLCAPLEHRGGFQVRKVLNPRRDSAICDAVSESLESLGGTGLLLFWFIGHGKPDDAHGDLHLLTPTSRENIGARWSTIAGLFERHRDVTKIAVVDCCHAALVRKHLPANTWIWPTAGEHEPASAGCFGADPAGKVNNFSWLVADLLENGGGTAGDVITFQAAFGGAGDLVESPGSPIIPISSVSGYDRFELAQNAPRAQKGTSYKAWV